MKVINKLKMYSLATILGITQTAFAQGQRMIKSDGSAVKLNYEEYYRLFGSRSFGNCVDDRYYAHQELSSEKYYIVLAPWDDGKEKRAHFTVWLAKDGKFNARYIESMGFKVNGDTYPKFYGYRSHPFWGSVVLLPNGDMELPGIGTMSPVVYNGEPALRLIVARDIMTQGIEGKTVILSVVKERHSEEATTNHCKDNPKYKED